VQRRVLDCKIADAVKALRAQAASFYSIADRGSIDNNNGESEDVVAVLGSAYVLKCERGLIARGAPWLVSDRVCMKWISPRVRYSRAPLHGIGDPMGIVSCEGVRGCRLRWPQKQCVEQ
jgi:hypothetical protein